MVVRIAIGAALAALVAGAGYARGSLSGDGFAAAVALGAAVFVAGGWGWSLALIAFFVSSSLLSSLELGRKESLAEKFAKGRTRDWAQVLANGGVPLLLAAAVLFFPKAARLASLGMVGALAAVTADTWATEIGVLGHPEPRLITTMARVPRGTSGGVSALGLAASLAGGVFIGGTALLLNRWMPGRPGAVLAAGGALGGIFGSLVDSLLGASLQGVYFCDKCGVETEQKIHRCGEQTRLVRGLGWMDNDLVNFVGAAAGATVSILLAVLLR